MANNNQTRASAFISANLEAYSHNPSLICGAMMQLLEQATDIDVVDVTNPFMTLLESTAVTDASVLARMGVITRRFYPRSAQTWEELYPHMSDKDTVDIFALPDYVDFAFIFSKEELLQKMVAEPNTGIRKLVIPRNTKIKAMDTIFSLEYPIEIRQMNHGGIQVVWDGEKTTPLKTLGTNRIEWFTQVDYSTKTEMLIFTAQMRQFDILSRIETINSAQQPSINIDFPDQFYYARVWHEKTPGQWVELPIVFSEATYSLTKPTAVVKVFGNYCNITLPQYYINNALVRPNTRIRADVYFTKGPVSLSLGNYDSSQYTVNWNAIDPADLSIYTAPLKALNTISVGSISTTLGGRVAMSFEAVRERVISNGVGSPKLPITPAQIQYALDSRGYTLVRNINTATKRIYLATRRMPEPINNELITAANAGIHQINASIEELALIDTVHDNGQLVTITPQTIYKLEGGGVSALTNAERNMLSIISRDNLANEITRGNYYYSPFHYVIDTSTSNLRTKAYYLQKPSITRRSFVAENDSTLLQVGIKQTNVKVTDTGYVLEVRTFSSTEYKEIDNDHVFVQLAFAPDASGILTYLNGTIVGLDDEDERIWHFDLSTNYLIDEEDKLELLLFRMIDQSPQKHRANLETKFSIIFSTDLAMPAGHKPNQVDAILGTHILPNGVSGIMHEEVTVKFGVTLNNLWTSSRSITSGNEYEVWEDNVPLLYESDVYKVDPNTGSTMTVVNGVIVQEKLHSRGEPVLNAQGEPVYQYYKGMVKYGPDGKPLVVRTRKTRRLVHLFLVEAAYYFGDSEPTINYRETLSQTVVSWVTTDLTDIQKRALDNTKILFYPAQTIGPIEVLYGPSLTTPIEAAQSFTVRVYVSNAVYRNDRIRDQIVRKTVETIQSTLENRTVSTSLLIDNIRDVYGDDVISFEISGIGGAKNLSVATILDDSRSLSLKKRLRFRDDNTLTVEEDVTVEFYRHTTEY